MSSHFFNAIPQRLSKNASKYGYARRPFAWTAHRLFEHRENQLHLVEGVYIITCIEMPSTANRMTSGPITLDNFWTISNDAIKPFDLYSAIQLTFSPTKSHQSSLSLGYEMLKIEGSLRFTVHEWRGFCKTRIRSVEQSALAVTLFDATRSGITFSDPSVSIFDSMHVVEVTILLAFLLIQINVNDCICHRWLSWTRWRASAIRRSTTLFLWLPSQSILQVTTSSEHFMHLPSW